MKLRLRRHETRETLKLEFADTFTLHDLQLRIDASSPSSVHLSLNRKDEIISSSPEDTLRSLGIASGDLLYYSLHPSAFVGCPQELEFASSVEGRQTPAQDAHDSEGKLGGQETLVQEFDGNETTDRNSTGTRSMEHDIVPENSNVSMNIENQANTDPNFGPEEQIEGHMQAISGKEEAEPMDVDYGSAVFASGKRLSEPFFLKKVLMEESGDTGELTLLILAVHAVMLESGFCRSYPGSGVQGEKFRFSMELPPIFLRYTLPDLIARGDPNMNDSVSLKFQNLGHVIIVYGKVGERSSVYRVSLEKRRFVPAIDLIMETLKSDKEGSSSVYREVFEFWKIVKDGLTMPLLIGLCDKTGLEPPACLMRLPAELKLKILESLPGVDIARMACVCSEMRYVASNNDLWKQKCLEVIPSSVAEAKGVASWKAKFATYWVNQKRQNRALPMARWIRPTSNLFPVWRDPLPHGFPPMIWYDRDRQPPALPFHFRHRTQGQGFGQLRRINFSPGCNLGGLN